MTTRSRVSTRRPEQDQSGNDSTPAGAGTPGLSLIARPPTPRPSQGIETAPAPAPEAPPSPPMSPANVAAASPPSPPSEAAPVAARPDADQLAAARTTTEPATESAGPVHVPDPQLLEFAQMAADDPRHATLRQIVVEANLPLVHHLAKRFVGRGEPYDDLVQVGTIGLLHAVDRYDPERGSFAGYAVPTIVGEIRRHFRDRGWALRIPRRVQDLGRQVSEARETLTHQLDRSPTVAEIATNLGVDADLVLEALETASAYLTVPLPATADETDRLQRACLDADLEQVEQREMLRPLLARLPVREQHILQLRFVKGLSQSQIAREVGVSQMHVSRLLAKSLAALRVALTERQ